MEFAKLKHFCLNYQRYLSKRKEVPCKLNLNYLDSKKKIIERVKLGKKAKQLQNLMTDFRTADDMHQNKEHTNFIILKFNITTQSINVSNVFHLSHNFTLDNLVYHYILSLIRICYILRNH